MPLRAMNGVDFASQRGINLASPSSATDAVNKAYVDNLQAGLEWKDGVVAATTTNGTLASSFANGSVIDTVTLATGNRILIKNQTTQSDNGIYTVNASGAPTRATDANTSASLNNATVFVIPAAGSVNGGTAWTQTTANPTVGTSNIVFSQFGAGTTYTAGNGIAITSGSIAVTPESHGSISVGSGGIQIGTSAAGSGIAVSANGVISLAATPLAKYAATLTSGSATYTQTHGLGTSDLAVMVVNLTTGQQEFPDVTVSSTQIVIAFGAATTVNYRVIAIG